MKKFSLILTFFIFTFLFGVATPALANQIIEVVPSSQDFGDVQVGSSSPAIITISNVNGQALEIYSVTLTGSADFSITMYPDITVVPGMSTDVEVTFTPSATGYVTAVLYIESNDGSNPLVSVSLSGMGVGQEEPPVSVADILAFFDESVANGTLYGAGPGNSADGRKNAFRNMIEVAGDLIDDGYIDEACQQLMNAYGRCDGLPRPPEFVAGPAAPELAGMILELMGSLGCP